ncbi:MAG: hypothetical protein HKN14_09440, partial [Marinicaulis sp.]|nr:hypothetical protein [Marinicaulis sp.]
GRLAAEEWLKFAVKKIAGRKDVAAPSFRDLKSRGMITLFDTTEEKRVLGWSPCADAAKFRARAIEIHAPPKL